MPQKTSAALDRMTLPSGATLYSVAEVAAIMGVSRRTIKKWLDAGDLPHLRLGEDGRLIRIRSDDVEGFLERKKA